MAVSIASSLQLPQVTQRKLLVIQLANGDLVERSADQVIVLPADLAFPLEDYLPPTNGDDAP